MKRRANGEGSIRQKKDGRWEGRYTAGYDLIDGKRIMKSVYATTQKECATKLAKAISENPSPYYRRGRGFEDRPLEDWCKFWIDVYCRPVIRPNSTKTYEGVLKNHVIPLLGKKKLSSVTPVDVQCMYNALKERGKLNTDGTRTYEPLSAGAVRQIHRVFKSCLSQAVRDRIIPYNPCENCKVPKAKKKKPVILPMECIGAYLEAAEQIGMYALFFLELTSGLRRGELLALHWNDLDVETRILTVNKQLHYIDGDVLISEPKTANAIRTVALPQQTVDLLVEEHNKHPESPLMFCSPKTMGYWHPNSIINLHRRILMTAGIEASVRFHDLRHTFATMAIQNGVDVKTVANMLGHYSAVFTLDTYTHVTKEMQQQAADKIGMFINSNIQININPH